MKNKIRILWVDDEKHFMSSYLDALFDSSEFTVEFVDEAEHAVSLIESGDFVPDVFVWDLIMPPGSLSLAETDRGLRTGSIVFRIFRRTYPSIPAILFTNVTDVGILDRYSDPDGLSWAWSKRDFYPSEFIDRIRSILVEDDHES